MMQETTKIMIDTNSFKIIKCILCSKKAKHSLGYSSLDGKSNWFANYCTDCLVKKLRGMARVHDKANKK